jgi:ribonuclease D
LDYIITRNKAPFLKIAAEAGIKYNFCDLEDMVLGRSIAIDTETTGLYPRNCDIFSVQIGTGSDNYLIDLQEWNDGFKFEQIIPFITDKFLILQNAQFDLTFFYKYGFYPDKIHDTFLASKILTMQEF